MAVDKSTLTEKNNVSVYNETTKPKKTKRRDKSDLGPDFVAPDAGWAWVVCLAAGFSNFSLFPGLQQYGLIYRQRMQSLGFDAKQTTTIVNVVMALSSLVGIVNGAMFRRFTFRQVAITGGLLSFIGLFSSAFCTTFAQYIISFSCIYGIGLGLALAATSLAVNTYFKNRRRRATGFTWTITGLGPIIFPHLTTFLLVYYGVQGTILIFAGIALNAILCGCTLQPVLWHVKPKPAVTTENGTTPADATSVTLTKTDDDTQDDYECKYCQHKREHRRSIFSSQYLFNADDEETPGYEIIEPMTPMLARANDGWFGSKLSLTSELGTQARLRQNIIRQASMKSLEFHGKETGSPLNMPNNFNREREEFEGNAPLHRCTCAEEKALLQHMTAEQLKIKEAEMLAAEKADELAKSKMSFKQKVVRFFDLDLLKDFTFVNLALGMTIMLFSEMNFSVLTPFILNSYGYTNKQISLAMSILGGMDISIRFLAPLALEKVKLANRVLFAFGIIAITIGRFLVTMTDSYHVLLGVFVLIGFGKAFRTIFSSLIIPSYVPLNRLPAASGLQLIFNTVFSMAAGPVLGIITDATNYSVTIHCLNALSILALLMWFAETVVRRLLGKPAVLMNG